jgi:rod shape-determining protein MreD
VYQSFFSELFKLKGVKFDLPILLIVYLAILRGSKEGALFGFSIGFLLDIFNPHFLGLGALIKCFIGFFVGNFKETLFLESIFSKVVILLLAVFINDLFYILISSGFGFQRTFEVLWYDSLLSGLYTCLWGFFLFVFPKKISIRLT